MPAKQRDDLVQSVDEFAKELMVLARNAETTLQVRLDVFRELARWVAVKHKVSETEDETDGLNELRKRIREPKASPASPGAVNRRGEKRGGHQRATPPEFGGSALAAIKRALPRANNGDDADHGDDN